MATAYHRCPACKEMHAAGDCRLSTVPRGVLPAPAVAPAARPGAPVRKAAPRPAASVPRPAPAPDIAKLGLATVSWLAAGGLPPEVVAHAQKLAGDRPMAEWVAELILKAKPPGMTAAERQRASRARKKGEKA